MRRTTAATVGLMLVAVALLLAGSAAAAPPSVTIESPDEGATVQGNVTINGTANDPDTYGSVSEVEVRIDNGTWMTANDTSGLTGTPWSTWNLTWNTSAYAAGNHTITARATDNTGETSTDTVNVTVARETDDGDDGPTGPPPADVNITVEAHQSGCPGNRTFCLEVTEGNLSALDPGLTVNATFVNPTGNFPHSLYLADHADADRNHSDTPASAAFGQVNTTQGGETASTRFTVPAGVDAIYVWCDETGHESQGMYLHGPGATHGNQTDGNGTDGGDGTDGDEDGTTDGQDGGQGLPGFGAGAAGLAVATAALALRRRRR